MPPKKAREQAARQVNSAKQALAPEVIAKRTKRHLDELERSNYAEPSISLLGEEEEDGAGGKYAKGRARQTISDKRHFGDASGKKKKTSMNVRTALLYRKNLATLIEEAGIAHLPPNVPTYLTAAAPPPQIPPRLLCSVCGYRGLYRCRKCAMPYCDLNCEGVHNETRCERRVI
ncbi:hypothetical protein BV22DRAFT_1112265 [Leucogyrophana mollusca]|uniref:Uncharacterized protein n=1 Tax=Leucogyrophana mollusca TaxID=85980 RepID=A0ACB8BI07_9AGAM|nr:hypothetical protein BV22DRAFT_1112265 [Leucogyrophana mollusca]